MEQSNDQSLRLAVLIDADNASRTAMRDVMAGDMPYIFVKHIYACASLVGAVICGVLRQPAGEMTAMLVGAAAVFAIRCLSAHYRWNLPHPNA